MNNTPPPLIRFNVLSPLLCPSGRQASSWHPRLRAGRDGVFPEVEEFLTFCGFLESYFSRQVFLKRSVKRGARRLPLGVSQSCTYCGSLRRIGDHPAER